MVQLTSPRQIAVTILRRSGAEWSGGSGCSMHGASDWCWHGMAAGLGWGHMPQPRDSLCLIHGGSLTAPHRRCHVEDDAAARAS